MKMTVDTHLAYMLMQQWLPNHFTYSGLEAVINYYDDLGYETEFCPECICGEWTEYGGIVPNKFADLITDYGYLVPADKWPVDGEEMAKLTVEALEEKTVVLKTGTGNYIVRDL